MRRSLTRGVRAEKLTDTQQTLPPPLGKRYTRLRCIYIQLFQERLSEEMRTRQSRKVIWDMINTLFVTTEAVEPTFVAFL